MRGSPGAKAYYTALKDRKTGHQAALRQLRNQWVGILHGCLKSGQPYNEDIAWGPPHSGRRLTFQNLGCLPRSGWARFRR